MCFLAEFVLLALESGPLYLFFVSVFIIIIIYLLCMCSVTEKPRRIGTLDSGFHASDGDDRMGTG